MTEPELIEAIKVYRFEPGDRLIVNVPGRCSMDTAERIRAMMEHWAPGVKVAVFPGGMSLDILRGLPGDSQPVGDLSPPENLGSPHQAGATGHPMLGPNLEIRNAAVKSRPA